MSARKERSRIYGPILLVKDIGASVKFYRDHLRLSGDAVGPWAEFRNGNARLVLLDRKFWSTVTGTSQTPAPSKRGGVVLGIQVRDVRADHRRLVQRGLKFDLPPTDVPQMGNRVALLCDPDGTLVELSTMLTKEDFERLRPSTDR